MSVIEKIASKGIQHQPDDILNDFMMNMLLSKYFHLFEISTQ